MKRACSGEFITGAGSFYVYRIMVQFGERYTDIRQQPLCLRIGHGITLVQIAQGGGKFAIGTAEVQILIMHQNPPRKKREGFRGA